MEYDRCNSRGSTLQMALIVAKFGGTSVATPERIKNVAKRLVDYRKAGNDVVAVVSAMGKSTDDLVKLAYELNPEPPARELDVLLSTGEQVSMSALAIAIEALGEKAISFTGRQAGMFTDSDHTKAKIQEVRVDRVLKAIDDGQIVVCAGFQGIDRVGDVTTLGRGGSDTTAVAIAAGLRADVCEIYTDVDGVYTVDPRMNPRAKKIDQISYDEMLELAGCGAGVLQARSVEMARTYNVVIHCRSAFNDEHGTIVKESDESMEQAIISGIAFDKSEAKVTIRDVPDNVGVAARVFSAISNDAHANIDMIIQNVSENGHTDISFTAPIADLERVRETASKVIEELGARELIVDEAIAKLSVIGAGMRSNPGVAARMFQSLADNDVNISMISTSAIRISVVIALEDLKRAIECLHTEFGLDSEDLFEETMLSSEELAAKAAKGR